MRAYLAQLRARSEETQRLYNLKQEAQAKLTQPNHQIKCTKPLEEQITELMQTLPPQLRDRPWSMAELVSRLTGKYRARPHAQQVGQALLRLNWRRERRWVQGFNGVRLWLPPGMAK